jgi:hypothetical protein
MKNTETADPGKVLKHLENLHAEFISSKRFMTAEVIVQAITLLRSLAPQPVQARPTPDATLRLKRAPGSKTVTAEEFLAELEQDESDPAYRKFLRDTLERMKNGPPGSHEETDG